MDKCIRNENLMNCLIKNKICMLWVSDTFLNLD